MNEYVLSYELLIILINIIIIIIIIIIWTYYVGKQKY